MIEFQITYVFTYVCAACIVWAGVFLKGCIIISTYIRYVFCRFYNIYVKKATKKSKKKLNSVEEYYLKSYLESNPIHHRVSHF